jgi:PAS domain S-box-containing protein
MELVDFVSKFEELRTRLMELSPGQGQEEFSHKAALTEETGNLLEELRVAAELLQQQNEEILVTHQSALDERLRYQHLFELAPSACLVTDLDGKIAEANLAAERLFNVPHIYLMGKPIAVFVALEERKAFRRQLAQIAASANSTGEQIEGWEFRFLSRNHDPVEVDITIGQIPHTMNLASSKSLLWILRDITAYKEVLHGLEQAHNTLEQQVAERTAQLSQANQRLELTAAELERRNRDLQDFAFVASHDLQEPLRKIQAFGGLAEGAKLPDEARDPISRMVNAAANMQRLLDSLLAYSRVGTQGTPFKAVDLNELIDQVMEDLAHRLIETGGEIQHDPLPTILGDSMQLRQLMLNLLINSLKFHRPDEPPRIQVSAKMHDSLVELRVADRGIGFDMRYAERIFQPFQRLHGRSEYSGTGMGLAICRKIVERHGGKITAESAPGQGAIFIISLPQEYLKAP